MLQQAVAHHQSGNLDTAARLYQQILRTSPRDFNALRLLGVVRMQMGNLDEAQRLLLEAIKSNDKSADAFYYLGRLFVEKKDHASAIKYLDRCIALDAKNWSALIILGGIKRENKEPAGAVALLQRALAINPNAAEVWYDCAVSLYELGRYEEALAHCNNAIALTPGHADAFNVRGLVLHALQRDMEALASCEQSLALKPDQPSALNNLGLALQALDRVEQALASYDKALAVEPGHISALINRGNALRVLHRHEEALLSFDKALAADPASCDALYNRAAVYIELNRVQDAIADYEAALAIKPDHAEAKFAICMAELPALYADQAEIADRRAAYGRRLQAFHDEVARLETPGNLAFGIGVHQPFALVSQGLNDVELQRLYGSLVCRIAADRYPPVALAPPPLPDEPIRIGIVNGYFRQHSVWKIPIKGMGQLDRQRFHLFGYHTGAKQDEETRAAAAAYHRFVQGPLSIDDWRKVIAADAPHVLIFAEVGMDPACAQLAAQRLAPVQCSYIGHPSTSGFPTVDYYLSSDLMEPPDGDSHYTERLVRLPNLSTYYEPIATQSVVVTRDELGFRSGATVYWSAQSFHKYLPQFDHVFPRIAQQAGDCQFVFSEQIYSAAVTDLFRERIDRAFRAFGLRAEEHCVVLPRLGMSRFIAAMGQADIFLDSIAWSGCNTAFESLPHHLPIVTLPGAMMRGRHCLAILNRMGVTETIASTIEDYVSIAARLARDIPWRGRIKAQMKANEHLIYRDREYIAGLENFINRVARGPRA